MSKHRTRGTWRNRLLSGVLCLALVLGLLPTAGLVQPAEAANWAEPYAEQLVEWGVMTPSLATNLGSAITRAEFVAMCNRAFGYKKLGSMPFVDVPSSAWYAEDINIAYNAGYFTGTSADPANPKASPNGTMTKEMAAVAVARNLMLQETVGESLGFTDSRDLHEWSRGMIGAAVAEGVITGLPDGSFRPFNNITRGEVAALLVRLIGTPVNKEGSYELGDVYGNVVISSSNVTLRDTVILGNLYVTGGVDLGNVLLENVTVLGKLVISGGGESHAAQSSVILRNVAADEMLVDSIIDQFVTISAYGVTDIPFTSVRTDAYLEDSCEAGYGLHLIELDGDAGTLLQLAGDIKEVVNKTPFSDLQLVKGTAQTITVDEYARGSQVLVSEGTLVYEMNLDVATLVTGKGDIRNLNISAAGCEVEILPENVTIRPGITATVDGQVIGDLEAAEMSSEPRLLAGYPDVTNIAPTQAEGLFAANKPGTIYWAISELADGSVSVDDLINNPAYGGNIFEENAGNISANAKTEYGRQISKLVPDGSYYISAVMVDGRGQTSPLKVAAFTTPDDTMPAFVVIPNDPDGKYPYMSKVSCDIAQVTAMANKSCLLYWALMPQGATAPTPQEFKSGSVGGNYGYGSVNVVKNVPISITVNRNRLQEKTTYWLYLWLTDHNGAQSMATPVRLEFTTPDETPPIVSVPIQTGFGEEDAEVTFSMNEPGTLYWAVVAESNESFIAPDADMASLRTKLKVETGAGGANVIVYGNTPATAANIDTVIRKEVLKGLLQEYGNSFKFYYVAKDADGNYSDEVKYIIIRTLDVTPPTVVLDYSSFTGEGESKKPQANSDIMLVFSEQVKGGVSAAHTFLYYYEQLLSSGSEADRNVLMQQLSSHIELCIAPVGRQPIPVKQASEGGDDWVIDWSKAIVTMNKGQMIITLPGSGIDRALNLASGTKYVFRFKGVFDDALTPNGLMGTEDGNYDLYFTTAFAVVELRDQTTEVKSTGDNAGNIRLDIVMDVVPDSTATVPATECWDLIMWSDNLMEVQVYRKLLRNDGADGEEIPGEDWELVTREFSFGFVGAGRGLSAWKADSYLNATDPARVQYEPVVDDLAERSLKEGYIYRYGVHIIWLGNQLNRETDPTATPTTWDEKVSMRFSVISGNATNIQNVSQTVNGQNTPDRNYNQYVEEESVSEVGVWYNGSGQESILPCSWEFVDTQPPNFRSSSFPSFTPGANVINMQVGLDRKGTVYWVAAPVGQGIDVNIDGTTSGRINKDNDGRAYDVDANGTYKDEAARKTAIDAAYGSKARTFIPLNGEDRETYEDYIHFMTGPANDEKHLEEGQYSSPNYLDIYNPNYSDPDVKSGYLEVSGRNDTPVIRIEGLKAETDYYIYIVMEGGGDPDHVVQIYRQTTTKAVPPVININKSGETDALVTVLQPSEDGRSTLGSYDNSRLYCALVERGSLPPLYTAYYTWTNTGTGTAPYTDTIDETHPAPSNVMTVLQAMATPYGTGGGKTWFDVYATDALKMEVMRYITGDAPAETTREPAARYNNNHNGIQDNPSTQYCYDDMASTVAEYVVLACARNGDATATVGTNYGFAVLTGLIKPDTEPPVFIGTRPLMAEIKSATVNGEDRTDWRTASTKPNEHHGYLYNGNVTITFNKVVYVAQSNGGGKRPIWNATSSYINSSNAAKAVNAISILDVAISGASLSLSKNLDGDQSSFVLNFRGLAAGATITMAYLCNSSNQSVTNAKTLTLIFDPSLTMSSYGGSYSDMLMPGFQVLYTDA